MTTRVSPKPARSMTRVIMAAWVPLNRRWSYWQTEAMPS